MSKTLTEAQVTTAKARSRLELGVHWRRLDAEAHLGYRKGKQGGIWFVRWRNHHEGGNYKQVPVGVANDINDKPADGILTFGQAVRTAREAVARARTEAASQAAGPAPTVRSAVESLRQGTRRSSNRRHYAKYIATLLEDLARAAVVPLVPRSDGNVVPMGKRA